MLNYINMKTKKVLMEVATILVVPTSKSFELNSNSCSCYILGGIIALLLLGYLFYTMIKPEKF
jgi:K+-transporting ATPase KdpF subunit